MIPPNTWLSCASPTSHVAQNNGTTKTGKARQRHHGILRVGADFILNLIAYNLIRIPSGSLQPI
jgi:hypothetical protein